MKTFFSRFLPVALLLFTGYFSVAQEIKLHNIFFDFDKYHLTKENRIILDSIAAELKLLPSYNIKLEGFTDNKGTSKYNFLLGSRRAETVFMYLKNIGIDSSHFLSVSSGAENLSMDISDHDKRKTTVQIEITNPSFYSFYGKEGTEVIAEDKDPVIIEEYFSTETMLRDSMYAFDQNGEPLVTGGMIKICSYSQTLDKSEKFYTIKIPFHDLQGDSAMKVWIGARNKENKFRWNQSTIEVISDRENKNYIFKIPALNTKGMAGCININLDKRCERGCFLYLTTYKPLKFRNIELAGLRFTGKPDDSTYIFSKEGFETKRMTFRGYFKQDSVLYADLSKCIFTKDDRENEYYFLCDTCYNTQSPDPEPQIIKAEKQMPVKKRRRGFFQWLGDLFRRKSS